jgi:diadenosine tetraphosphatase ApaH/serine/threonine PP2A family protein phosphatase
VSYEWTRQHVSPSTKRYLGELPFRMDLRPRGGHSAGPRVILVHGTPVLNTVYWTHDRPDSFCMQMAQLAGARAGDVLCFGHTHVPWQRFVEGITFVNTASVGRPKDGDWRAGFVILDMHDEHPVVEFVRVDYDVHRAVEAIMSSELPNDFARHLETGGL